MTIQEEELLYGEAEKEKTFIKLLNHPRLLFRWQRKHRDENKRIATISSHRLGHHIWCDTKEKCYTIETFLNKYGIKTV